MSRIAALIHHWSEQRQIRTELNAMSDHLLEDIGLCRADIPR